MFDDQVSDPNIAYLVNTSQVPANFNKSIDLLNKDILRWQGLVGDLAPVVQTYRLKAKSNFLDLNLLTQCVRDILARDIDTAGEAWAKVVGAMGSHGARNKPQLHTITMAVIEALGGWQALVSTKSMVSERSNFYTKYNQISIIKLNEAFNVRTS